MTPVAAISAIANRTALTIQQGSSDTLTVTVGRSGGYTGPVTWTPLIADGAALSAVVDHIFTTGNVTTARVTLGVGAAFPVGVQTFTLIVQPTGSVAAVRVEVTVNVTAETAVMVSMPQSIGAYQGGTGTYSGILVRRTNYSGPLTLSLTNLPAGITASFKPNPLMGTDSVADLTLAVDPSVPLGTYHLEAQADGGTAATQAAIRVTMTIEPIETVALALSADPMARAGGTVVDTVKLTRNNFDGIVNLSFGGLPAGVTVTTAPIPPYGAADVIVLTFSVAPGQPAGRYPIAINGTAYGAAPTNISVLSTLTITP